MTILDIVIQGTDDASDELKSVDSALSGLGKTAGGAVKAGMAVAGAGIVAVGAAAVGAAVSAVNLSSDISSATNNIASQLGIGTDIAQTYEGAMKSIFANNFGDSFDDIGNAIVTVTNSMGDMSNETLQGVVEDAFALRDAFGLEVNESVMAASNLMNEFGLSGEEAMDMVAAGMQSGLNASGDFVDSISEYGNLFADAGFSADQMYSIMATGAETGVLGVDKIADAVKEMGIKLNEGGDDTVAAFDAIGMEFDTIAASVAAGDETWGDYFDDIVAGIEGIEDPIERQRAQVGIFGTMAEDLGVSFTEGLSAAKFSLEDMGGATEALNAQYENWPDMWEGIKRNALLALEPLGDVMLRIGNEVMPIVQEGFQWLGDNVGPIIETIAEVIDSFLTNLEEGMSPLDAFVAAIEGFVPPEVIEAITTIHTKLGEFMEQIQKAMEPIFEFITNNVELKDVLIVVGGIIAGVILSALASLIVALAPVILAFFAAVAVVATLRRAWEEDFAGIRDFVADIWDAIQQAFDAFKLLFQGDFDGFLEGIKSAWSTAWNAIVEFLGNIWDMVQPKLAALWASFVQWFNDTDWVALALTLMMTIANGLDAFWDWISPKLVALWDAFVTWFNDTDWLQLAINLMTAIADGLDAFWDWVLPKLEALFTAIERWFAGIAWGDLAQEIMTKVGDGLSGFWDAVSRYFNDLWRDAEDWFSDIDWKSLGESIMSGVAEGIEAGASKIVSAAKTAAQNALDRAKEKLGIASPSSVWAEEVGKPIAQGMADGISENEDVAVEAAWKLANDVINAGGEGILDGLESLMTAMNEISKYLNNQKIGRFAQSAMQVFEMIGAAITASALLAETDFPSIVRGWHLGSQMNIFQKIVNTIMNMFHALSGEFDAEHSKTLQEYVEAADDIFDLVEGAIEASTMLSDVDFEPIVRGKEDKPFHLRDQMVIFRNIVRTMVDQYILAAAEMGGTRLKAVQDFATAANKLFEGVEMAIAGSILLSEVDFTPIIRGKEDKPFHLRNQMELFRKIIATLVRQFGIIADELGGDSVSNIAKLAGSINRFIKDTTDIIEGIFEMIDAINELVTADMPGGLREVLSKMIMVMSGFIAPAENVGLRIGDAFIDGIKTSIAAGIVVINQMLSNLGGGGGGVGGVSLSGVGGGSSVGGAGFTTNVNMGGMTFNTTIGDQMTEDEFIFRVTEVVRGMVT